MLRLLADEPTDKRYRQTLKKPYRQTLHTNPSYKPTEKLAGKSPLTTFREAIIIIEMRNIALIEIVKTIPLFSQLRTDEIKPLIADNQLFIKNYSKGVTVYNQNDSCRTLDVVLSGSFVAYSLSENGSAMTMFEFSKGQMFGANLLFGDNHTYPLTIYCMSNAQLLHITQKAICSFLHNYNFAIQFIGMISHNSQKLNQRITIVAQNTLRENLLEYFRQQSILQCSNTIVLPISKKQLADYLGVQRPSLFRELKNLKDEGVIDVSNRTINLNHATFVLK